MIMTFPITLERAKELSADPLSSVKELVTRKIIRLPALYIGRLRTGVTAELDACHGRYSPEFGGVLIGYDELRLVDPLGVIMDDDSSLMYEIQARFYIFKPEKGAEVKAIVNKVPF